MPSITKLHHQFLLTQRKMRWLRINTPHDIDPWASNLLPILSTQKVLSPSAISEYLQMHPSGVSRMLRHLGDLGYISIRAGDSDARRRKVELTPAGRRALLKSIQLDTYLSVTGTDPLGDHQRDRVAVLFGEVSDAFGAAPEESLPHELAFTTEQKRIARVLGMIGSNYLGTRYDINQYQILFYLYRAPRPVRFKELALILPLETSKLSRQLDRYISEEIIRKGTVRGDRRGTSFTLTRRGRTLFKSEDDRAQLKLATVLSRWNQSAMTELIDLLSQATSRPPVITHNLRFRVRLRDADILTELLSHNTLNVMDRIHDSRVSIKHGLGFRERKLRCDFEDRGADVLSML